MHIGVNLEIQKIGSSELDDLRPEEIDYFLNVAIKDYIEEQYTYIKNPDRSPQGHLVNDNLYTLINTKEINDFTDSPWYYNSIKGNLPSDYYHYLFGVLVLSEGGLPHESSRTVLRYMQPKGLSSYLSTNTNMPIYREYPILISGGEFTVIGDSRNKFEDYEEYLKTVYMKYLKQPKKVSLTDQEDSDLPTHTHDDIVQIAVQRMKRALLLGDPTDES